MHPTLTSADSYDDMLAAVKSGDVTTMKILLAKGVSADSADKVGNTLLITAASAGHLEAVKLLVAAKAKVNARTQYGETALMMAAIRGHRSIVEYLIAHGADLNHEGWSALMFAAVKGHADIARLLIAKGSGSMPCRTMAQPLMLAAKETISIPSWCCWKTGGEPP
jgi:ankyrin repeat protein